MTLRAPERVLIVRLTSLGDVIHTIPAAVALRRGLPHAEIVWVVDAAYREIVELCAPVTRVVVAPLRRWRRSGWSSKTWHEALEVRRTIVECGADAAVDFQGLMKSAAIAWMSGAPLRIGFDRRAIREPVSGLVLNRRVRVDRDLHVVGQNLALARAAGAAEGEPDFTSFSRFPGDPEGTIAAAVPRGGIVINAGAGHRRKQWPVAQWTALGRSLRESGRDVTVVWGPGERPLAAAVAAGAGARLAPETNLRELAFVLEGAGLLISADSGPLHLAAAIGTSVIGLFGPTRVRRNGPYGQLERCVTPGDGSDETGGITLDQVLRHVDEVMR